MVKTPEMAIRGQSVSSLHSQQFVGMVTSNGHLERSQGKANERRHTLKLRTITLRSNLCQRLPCCAHVNRCVCFLQTTAWSRLGLELCVYVCTRTCVCICLLASVILCLFMCVFFSHRQLGSFFPHTQRGTHTAQCSVTRRKETQGKAAHLTGIQLSMSNGGHLGEEEGETDLQWWRRVEGNFCRELFFPSLWIALNSTLQ